MADIEWVVFDLGGVLVDYRPLGLGVLAKTLGRGDVEVYEFVSQTGLLDTLARGAISPEEGLARLNERFGTQLGRADAVACFAADVEQVLPGADELVASLQGRYRLGVLSNTFFGHWDYFVGTPLYARFDHATASHLLQASKPEPEIYERALAEMNARAERVAFVDDKEANVDAARALGIHGIHSTDVETTRRKLGELLG